MPATSLDEVWGPTADEPPPPPMSSSMRESAASTDRNGSGDEPVEKKEWDVSRLEGIMAQELRLIRAENERRFHLCVGGACLVTVFLLLYIDRLQFQLRHMHR